MAKYTTSKTEETAGSAIDTGLASIAAGFVFRFAAAYELMLLIGAAHAELDSRIPAYGYWGVFFALWIISAVRSVFKFRTVVVKS